MYKLMYNPIRRLPKIPTILNALLPRQLAVDLQDG